MKKDTHDTINENIEYAEEIDIENAKRKAEKLLEEMETTSDIDYGSEEFEEACNIIHNLEIMYGKDNIISISSLSEYVESVKLTLNEFDNTVYSRGAANSIYTLEPSVYRYLEDMHISTCKDLLNSFKEVAVYYDKALMNAKDYNYAVYGQHFGLPTALLDFTTAHLISLYFCVSNEIETDGVVYFISAENYNYKVANKNGILRGEDVDGYDNTDVKPFFTTAPVNNSRIHAQRGVFLFFPTGSTVASREDRKKVIDDLHNDLINHGVIKLFYIENIYKETILQELESLGIDHERIYPDIKSAITTVSRKIKGGIL